ncbi:hypothetical protein ACWEQ8_29240, partial [Streptomyces noursei]
MIALLRRPVDGASAAASRGGDGARAGGHGQRRGGGERAGRVELMVTLQRRFNPIYTSVAQFLDQIGTP